MSRFPTAFAGGLNPDTFPLAPVRREGMLVRHLLMPFDGILTIDTTGEAKLLWDARDERYGEQPTKCERIWLTGLPGNNFSLFLGSGLVDAALRRGHEITVGERLPPFGPISLKMWWCTGTAGDQLSVFYYPPDVADTFVDGNGQVIE